MARKEHGRSFPDSIKADGDAQAIYGIVEPILKLVAKNDHVSSIDAADISKTIVTIIKEHHIVDVWSNEVAQNNMRNVIDDYFFDVVRDQKGIELPLDHLDDLEHQIMDVARARFPG